MLNPAARKEAKRLKLGRNPEGIQISPKGAQAYVAVNGDNKVAIVDLKTGGEPGN